MSAIITIKRAGPLTTIQDHGRFGMLRHGISASGPMDRASYDAIAGGHGAVEFTAAGIEFEVASGTCQVGFAGGHFQLRHNNQLMSWPGALALAQGETVAITPGAWGNYGYLRFDADILVPSIMGSIATSSRAGLGGLSGRALRAGDVLEIGNGHTPITQPVASTKSESPIRITWGLHADLFAPDLRQRFLASRFKISSRMDRMGIRLDDTGGVFRDASALSLVSDAIVPGDIQILGDGTPTVLMRDHQPTGGYPRIATVISADLDRFAQLRPGTAVEFVAVSVEHAHALLRGRTA